MSASNVRVYLACSLDGFIAGPDHDLSWLPDGEGDGEDPGASEPGTLDYEAFIADVGALLMGRNTYDVVRGFDVPWPYGERPVLVATRRSLDSDPPATVQAIEGPIEELVQTAKAAAGGGDVYLDGGGLIRQAAEADLIDEITLTLAPIALGQGIPLFAGLKRRYAMEIVSHHDHPFGMVQLRARPKR
ncbi:MAG: dihydrofolate reductase family protein [Acidobacteriota bacterium]